MTKYSSRPTKIVSQSPRSVNLFEPALGWTIPISPTGEIVSDVVTDRMFTTPYELRRCAPKPAIFSPKAGGISASEWFKSGSNKWPTTPDKSASVLYGAKGTNRLVTLHTRESVRIDFEKTTPSSYLKCDLSGWPNHVHRRPKAGTGALRRRQR